jgi:hypothetical protein
MNSNLESAGQGELALTDWFRIAGLLIFLAFGCFSIVLFGKGANHASPNPTQPVVQASTPSASLEPRPESTPEASAQSVTAATEPETRSESTPFSGEALSLRLQQPPVGLETGKPAIADAKGANAIGKHRTNSVTRHQASRRRSTVEKVVLKSVNTLVGMWRRTFKANK